ncbi:PREDICTED: chromatin assembly factor 1 subunit B [Rhagoletis zephyria]|uniref:chromatin assembly factor 1 subunit B n=1 Tax=Rhagoletis zephyria TaxID=28612 RepID=UPI00081176DA|nr:PREDICTED: chromatin assembly factor 1 subunit B [Rhagoletis zephyria]
MKCKIPEISWHNRDPVLSVDIQPKSQAQAENSIVKHRLASGGTDAHVLIWYMNYTEDGNDIELDLAADLTRHQRAVNAVKWSPNGELLASGDDESVVFIWKQKGDQEPLNILDNTNEQDKEVWIVLKVLRGHMEDIYDLSWASNSQFLVSGSVDNTAIVWDVNKGKSMGMLRDHKSFVQGVAWDPKNQYIATLSSDRYLRIFDIQTKKVLHRINKSTLPVSEGHELHGQRLRLFHDDTLQTFFRRLCFTPDGKLLLTPAGVAEIDSVAQSLHTTYVFSRHAFRQPAIVLPCPGQYTVAVRCCPILYRLRPHKPDINPPVVPLQYRMIFAVATRCSVYFYDTQQRQPFAVISNIHYTRLTDVTWSSDGRIVVVSSTDGFCSLITFEAGELGEEYENAAQVLGANDTSAVVKRVKKQKENDGQGLKERKQSTDEQKNISMVKRDALTEISEEQSVEDPMQEDEAQRKPPEEVVKSISAEESAIVTPAKEGLQKNSSNTATALAITNTLGAKIIIDKEILSSDERFESPEKKSRPVTPITVRRTPRGAPLSSTTKTSNTPTASETNPNSAIFANTLAQEMQSPASVPKLNAGATRLSKGATPISIRRAPRAIIAAPAPPTTTTVEEVALDAWPTPMEVEDEESAKLNASQPSKAEGEGPIKTIVATNPKAVINNDTTLECTEDIRLVYEDSVDVSSADVAVEVGDKTVEKSIVGETPSTNKDGTKTPTPKTPMSSNKTPRRVALKTISTPTSKKKLLD